jgi:hypothetical protein
MRLWHSSKHAPSEEAHESMKRAQDDLLEQRMKHEKSQEVEDRLVEAFERNHLAELMFDALERKLA